MTSNGAAGRLAAVLTMTVLAAACGGAASTSPTSAAAAVDSRLATSHNAGQDCLRCHREFAVAGTVYHADGSVYPGATVRLTTAASGGGTVVLIVTSDASGSFHTSQLVAFGSGLYADAAAAGGAPRSMAAAVTSGACNSCHDSTNRIGTD